MAGRGRGSSQSRGQKKTAKRRLVDTKSAIAILMNKNAPTGKRKRHVMLQSSSPSDCGEGTSSRSINTRNSPAVTSGSPSNMGSAAAAATGSHSYRSPAPPSPPPPPMEEVNATIQSSDPQSQTGAHNADDTSSTAECPRPPKRSRPGTSAAWQHFEVDPNDRARVVCNHCKANIKRGSNPLHMGTSALWSHIKVYHLSVLHGTGTSIPPSFSRNSSSNSSGQQSSASSSSAAVQSSMLQHVVRRSGARFGERRAAAKVTRTIAEMIALDNMPLNTVEHTGFRRLLGLLAPEYKIPSRSIITRSVVPSLYDRCKAKVLDRMIKTAIHPNPVVHFTADLWTSGSGLHGSFLSLTAHWWGQENTSSDTSTTPASTAADEELKTVPMWALLHVEEFVSRHFGDLMAVAIERQINGWISGTGLIRGFLITDNARNIKKAASAVTVNINCMAHSLHLAVVDALGMKGRDQLQHLDHETRRLGEIIQKCRTLAAHFHRSCLSRTHLHKAQVELGLQEHLIPVDVATRWNSTFQLLERLLEQNKAIHDLGVKKQIKECEFSQAEWRIITEAVSALRCCEQVTKRMSGAKAPLSMALPSAVTLSKRLLGIEQCMTTSDGKALARRLRDGVESRLVETFMKDFHYGMATMLDPRLKERLVPVQERSDIRAKVIGAARTVREWRLGPPPPEQQSQEESNLSQDDSTPERTVEPDDDQDSLLKFTMDCAREGVICFDDSEDDADILPNQPVDDVEQSLRSYLAEPLLKGEDDSIPCEYWGRHRKLWPDLESVARKYLSAPPTSVQSERVFSLAGEVITSHRRRTGSKVLEQLVFLKANLPLLGFPDMDLGPDALES